MWPNKSPSQPPLALAVPLSRFTSRVGSGSTATIGSKGPVYETYIGVFGNPRPKSPLAWFLDFFGGVVEVVLLLAWWFNRRGND
jgi:hypothetical protein